MAAVSIQRGTDLALGDMAGSLQRHLRARLPCRCDAEDLAQEAYLKFLQAAQRGLEIENPKTYLFTIAHNLLHHHYKAEARATASDDVDVESLQSDDVDVERNVMDAARIDRINRAWRELPPKCQRVLQLRWREGLRVKEICTEMDLSQGMVKKYLATGLAHFRKRLGRYIEAAGEQS